MENQENKFKNLPKVIFLILGIIIVVEIIMGISSLMQKATFPAQQSEAILPLTLGKFSFDIEKNKVAVGESLPVNLVLDTGGYTIASASVAIKFDPQYFESTTSGYINVNKIYTDGFNGIGNLANFNLKSKKSGNTVIETSLGHINEFGSDGKDIFGGQYLRQEIIIVDKL